MNIHTPNDLFEFYNFDDEVKMEITQMHNLNKNIIKNISSLCLAITRGIRRECAIQLSIDRRFLQSMKTDYGILNIIFDLECIKEGEKYTFVGISLRS